MTDEELIAADGESYAECFSAIEDGHAALREGVIHKNSQ